MTAIDTAPHHFLVIDDHPLFCDALTMTIRSFQAKTTVTSANSLSEGMAALDGGLAPDVILLDLNLPDVEGIDGLTRLRARLSDTPVVVISSYDDNAIITRVLRAGAVGFISKRAGGAELERAFHRIWHGETYTPPDYRPVRPADGKTLEPEASTALLDRLTPQQRRILHLVSEGRLNKQIAGELSIAETTVKAHLTVILRKLGVQSRTQAALIAQKAQMATMLREA